MKKVLLTIAVMGVAVSVLAQGTVIFNNNGTGYRAPVYGPDPLDKTLSLQGNTATGIPAGSTVYGGPLLAGTNYMAQLFAGLAENDLVAQTPISTFRAGGAAGFLPNVTITLTGIPKDAPLAWFQIRAWDNTSGLYPTWTEAAAAWQSGSIAAGMGNVFSIEKIGGDINLPPTLSGQRSFNIYLIPEPSTFALAGLGAAALMIFRRRK